MNERIRELEKQAIDALRDKPFSMEQFREKFAELIVRECMNLVKDCYAEPESGQSLYQTACASTIIEDHFGVEENKSWVCPKCGVDRTKAVCPQGYTATIEGKCPMIGVAQ